MKWYRHDTDAMRNRKIRKVIRTHGMLGYGVWFAILEKLYEAEGTFAITADQLWLEDFADECKITDYRTLIRVFDTFSECGLISSQLWAEHIIYCNAISERGDAYIEKRAKEAEKKRKQRAQKALLSLGDKEGTKGQSSEMSPTDPEIRDQIQNTSYKPIDLSASCESDAQVSTIQGSERLPKRATEAFFSRIVATYNDRKPRNWANCTKCNDNRLKLLNRLIEVSESYEDANQWVIDALEYVSSDPWWKELKGEFEKLFRDSRFVQFAEKARQARVEDSSSPEAVQAAISKELKRLAINGILPNEWQQKTGVAAISDLGTQDAIAYLTYLRGISDATAAAR